MATKQTDPVDATRVSFRLQPEIAAELADQAARLEKSHNILARELVTASLVKAEEQRSDLEWLHAELARIRTALSAMNESHEGLESLTAEVAAIRDTAAATDERLRALDVACRELTAVCVALRAADEQRHRLLETLCKDFAGVRAALSSSVQRQDFETLRSEVARLLVESQQVPELRNDLATSVHILLAHAGKLTPEQSKAWVQQALLKH